MQYGRNAGTSFGNLKLQTSKLPQTLMLDANKFQAYRFFDLNLFPVGVSKPVFKSRLKTITSLLS
jgi:hypothetical protein